jgi:WD40 repeat protein
LHPNGKLAVFGGRGGRIYTVNVDDLFVEQWPALEGGREIHALAFSHDGDRLASSTCSQVAARGGCLSNSIWLWDVESQEPSFLSEVEGVGKVLALAFDPDAEYLAVGTEEGVVSVVDTDTGSPLALHINPSSSEVFSLEFSQNGRMLAGGNRAGDMLLWSAESDYQELGRLNIGSSGTLYSMAFDLDGLHLYTGGESGDIYKWAISPDLWIEIICERVGRDLSLEEWRTFFFNENVEPTCITE